MLEQVGLADKASDKAAVRFGEYSMGMRQRLGLAAAFLHEPTLVILDEPTSGLDPVGRTQVHGLIRRLATQAGTSVLLSTHLLSEVTDLCDRTLVIELGTLILEQPLGDPGAIGAVERCFAGLAERLAAAGEAG
jgi:ABC-2 type transport system ATP-binding protein